MPLRSDDPRDTAIRIGVTVGDPTGIGPEVVLKMLAGLSTRSEHIILFGPREWMFEWAKAWIGHTDFLSQVEWVDIPWEGGSFGVPSAAAGDFVWNVLQDAFDSLKTGAIDAVVTAPIIKKNLALAGHPFQDHTSLLGHVFGCRPVMSMITPHMRVAFYTAHVPLARVATLLASEPLRETIQIVYRELQERFGLRRPHLAVCGFNPHAGEGGILGEEEERVIRPVIQALIGEGLRLSGPYPPETVFRYHRAGQFDAVLAMYHDQGMIPVKLLDFGETANYTMGLPAIRTSPDHGAAPDIAGKNQASPSGMQAAFRLAVDLARRMRKTTG